MEQRQIHVTVGGETRNYPAGTSYAEVVKEFEGKTDAPVILVTEDGRLRELHKRLKNDCTVELITTKDPIGY